MQLKQFDMHTLLCLSLMMQHEPALRYGGGPPARWYWDRVWSFLAARHISNSSLQNISASRPAFLPPSLEDRYFTPCLLQNTITVSPCLLARSLCPPSCNECISTPPKFQIYTLPQHLSVPCPDLFPASPLTYSLSPRAAGLGLLFELAVCGTQSCYSFHARLS